MNAMGNGTPTSNGAPLLRVEALRKHFPLGGLLSHGRAPRGGQAVDGVSFDILPHETVSLVGSEVARPPPPATHSKR